MVCNECGVDKPKTEFYQRHRRCKDCHRIWSLRHYHSLTPEQRSRRSRLSRLRHVERVFGISAADYEALEARHAGACGICGKPFVGRKEPHLDHDHVSGAVRGLLCVTCNTRLATIEDDEWMAKARDYLSR